MKMVFVAYVKSEKTLSIALECNKENISSILRNTFITYKMDFNIKNLLDGGCTQSAVFRLLSLITNGNFFYIEAYFEHYKFMLRLCVRI